jgi:hypothetical protein
MTYDKPTDFFNYGYLDPLSNADNPSYFTILTFKERYNDPCCIIFGTGREFDLPSLIDGDELYRCEMKDIFLMAKIYTNSFDIRKRSHKQFVIHQALMEMSDTHNLNKNTLIIFDREDKHEKLAKKIAESIADNIMEGEYDD